MDIRDGTVHVSHAVQRLDLDDCRQCRNGGLIHLASNLSNALPGGHHLAEGTGEHLVIPPAHEAVGTVVNAVAPSARQRQIAREGIGAQALRHLIVRREAVARAVIEEDDTVDQLGEKGAHVLVVVGEFLVGELVLVGVNFVKRLGACRQHHGDSYTDDDSCLHSRIRI